MKLITFTVPCYNSEAYMEKCINSLLKADAQMTEIIIVDDGSTDKTPMIADRYAVEFPEIIKVIHQENGGHGEAVNTGLKNADGKYFKVVDSDDWLDDYSLSKVIEKLKEIEEKEINLDMLIANYVYEKVSEETSRAMTYSKILPVEKYFSWEDMGKFTPPNYILMHSVIYKTEILRDSHLVLPKHTFYVDNIFVYQPLPYVKTMYYMDVDLYRYYIGRADQSVNEQNMIKRIDQQISVTKTMIDLYDIEEIMEHNQKLGRYLLHYISMMVAICFIFLMIDETEESLEKIKEIKLYLKSKMPSLYDKIIHRSIAFFSNIPTHQGRKAVIGVYHMLRKIYKFN